MAMKCGHNDCIYASRTSGLHVCTYILVEKQKRGCKCALDCDKFLKGKKKRTTDLEDDEEYIGVSDLYV